jgi:8-oxo-dGTP pyrophosphatase MutT (NUDIX family)
MLNTKEIRKKIQEILATRNPKRIEEGRASLIHAAVLIPLFAEEGESRVLFIQRTETVQAHKGQISFPGGGIEADDRTPEEAALREAREEVGLREPDVNILGRIDEAQTLTSNYLIHPFVGWIPHPYDFQPSADEVKGIITAPLRHFFDPNALHEAYSVAYGGRTYPTPAYIHDGDVIWGATARIMTNLVEILKGAPLDYPWSL